MGRKVKNGLALLLSLRMVLGLFLGGKIAIARASESVTLWDNTAFEMGENYAGKTVILHSNDVHGAVMGYAHIAALKTEFKEKGADVILADAGDYGHGDYVSLSRGADAIAMMNAAGYDVATLGNHEFNYGYEHLMDNLQAAQFPVICADVLKDGETILDPTWTYEKGDLKIGFFGMDTPETQTKANPGLIQDLQFLSKGDLYACAQEQIDALRGDGADIVIALAHLGVSADSAPDGHRSADLYHNVTNLNFIIDGHSHTVMTKGENGEPIQSTGASFANVGVVVIDNASESIESNGLIKMKEPVEENGQTAEKFISGMAQDPNVAALAQEIMDRVDAKYEENFAFSEIFPNGERNPGVRTQETNLGDLITDAMTWKILKENGDLTVDDDHVVGILNAGDIRASIQPGDVTRKDLNMVLPFENIVSVVYVTGAELLEALEASALAAPDAAPCYPQTTGIEFTLDLSKPFDKGKAYPESTYYKPAAIQRVTVTKINGEPFDLSARYAVVTSNFLAGGGDSYYVFRNATDKFETGILLNETVIEYIDEALGGLISAETYGEARGDQTIFQSVTVPDGTGGGLAEAFANSLANGVNVRASLSGYTSFLETLFVKDGRNITLNLVGHTLTAAQGAGFALDGGTQPFITFIRSDRDLALEGEFREQDAQDEQSGENGRDNQGVRKSKGCYVATSVYGSYDCPEVWTLRRFRDEVLAETWYGRLFIRFYYALSPTAVKLFGDCEWFRNFFRGRLDKMVSDLQANGFESAPYQDLEW